MHIRFITAYGLWVMDYGLSLSTLAEIRPQDEERKTVEQDNLRPAFIGNEHYEEQIPPTKLTVIWDKVGEQQPLKKLTLLLRLA